MRAPDPPPVPMPRPRSAHIPPRSCPPLPSSPPLSCSPLPPPSRNPSGPRSCTQVTVWRTALWTRIPPLCGFLPSAPPPRGRILSIAPPPAQRTHRGLCRPAPTKGGKGQGPFSSVRPSPGVWQGGLQPWAQGSSWASGSGWGGLRPCRLRACARPLRWWHSSLGESQKGKAPPSPALGPSPPIQRNTEAFLCSEPSLQDGREPTIQPRHTGKGAPHQNKPSVWMS